MMSERIGIITQARTTSTRLPGKILRQANGRTMLEHHINRLGWSNLPVYIATTLNDMDEPIVELAASRGWAYYRGDEANVLDRYYQCAKQSGLNTIIRVTSDCPLIDGRLIARGLVEYLASDHKFLYYSNCIERTFPRGLDFEIFPFGLLEEAFMNATTPAEREHVTPYLYQNKSSSAVIKHLKYQTDYSHIRWTLDTLEDWSLLNKLFVEYNAAGLGFESLIEVMISNPRLMQINSDVKQKEL